MPYWTITSFSNDKSDCTSNARMASSVMKRFLAEIAFAGENNVVYGRVPKQSLVKAELYR
jgi:hypothetical protein